MHWTFNELNGTSVMDLSGNLMMVSYKTRMPSLIFLITSPLVAGWIDEI